MLESLISDDSGMIYQLSCEHKHVAPTLKPHMALSVLPDLQCRNTKSLSSPRGDPWKYPADDSPVYLL